MPTTLETLTRKMRDAQNRYFRERTQSALSEAKKYERMVDAELAKLDDERERADDERERYAMGKFFERE